MRLTVHFPVFAFAFFSITGAWAATVPHCPTDDSAIVTTIPAGQGVAIWSARPRGEVIVIALQYDRGDGKGWQWDGIPYQQWDAIDAVPKQYPQQTAGAFDAVPATVNLKIKVYARQRAGHLEGCADSVQLGHELDANQTPSLGIVASPGAPVDTVLWFCKPGIKCPP
jgi:hypothetical protein